MKNTRKLIIWILALVALLIAAYTFYDKYKAQLLLEPPLPNVQREEAKGLQQETTETTGQAEGSSDEAATGSEDIDGRAGPADQQDEGQAASDKVMAPDFTLSDLDGNEITLSDYRGKIVILNFWAVWCRYCVEEMPDFHALNEELEESGDAVILAVNVQESSQTIQTFLDQKDFNLRVLMDEDGAIASTYGIQGLPTTFFINTDGSLYTYIPGMAELDTLHTILDMMRRGEPLR